MIRDMATVAATNEKLLTRQKAHERLTCPNVQKEKGGAKKKPVKTHEVSVAVAATCIDQVTSGYHTKYSNTHMGPVRSQLRHAAC